MVGRKLEWKRTGSGLGVFFTVVPLTAQNALPQTRLGVGTAAMRSLGPLGPTPGVALVGTVVNSSLRFSFAVALQRGFWVVFVLGMATLVMTGFLRDVPMTGSTQELPTIS